MQVYLLVIVPMPKGYVLETLQFFFKFGRKNLFAVLLHEVTFAQGSVQHKDVEPPGIGLQPFELLEQLPVVVDVGKRMNGHVPESPFFPNIAEGGVHAGHRAQGAQDGTGVHRFGCFVVAGNNHRRYVQVAQPAQLFQTKGEGAVARTGAVEKIARMNHQIGFFCTNPINNPFKSIVHILFAGIDAVVIDVVVGLKTEVGIGKMDDVHACLRGKSGKSDEISLWRMVKSKAASHGYKLSAMVSAVLQHLKQHIGNLVGDDFATRGAVGHQTIKKFIFLILDKMHQFFRGAQNALERFLVQTLVFVRRKNMWRGTVQAFCPDKLGIPDVKQGEVQGWKTGRRMGIEQRPFGVANPVNHESVGPVVVRGITPEKRSEGHGVVGLGIGFGLFFEQRKVKPIEAFILR